MAAKKVVPPGPVSQRQVFRFGGHFSHALDTAVTYRIAHEAD